MPLPQDRTSAAATHVAAPGAVRDTTFPRTGGAGTGAGNIVESLGHVSGSLQTLQTGAGTPTVLLEGSNDATNWTTVVTHAHGAAGSLHTVFVDKPFRFFRPNKTVDSTGTVDYFLRLTGMGGGA